MIALTPALLFNDFACEFGFRGHTFQNIRLMEGLQGLNILFICPYAVYSRKIRPREASEGGFRKVESELNVPSNEKRGVLKKEKWVRRTVMKNLSEMMANVSRNNRGQGGSFTC